MMTAYRFACRGGPPVFLGLDDWAEGRGYAMEVHDE